MPFHISHLLPAPTESTDQLLSCPSKLDYPELKMQNSVECEETCLVDKMPATRLLLSSNKHFHVVVQLLIWPQHWKTPILQLCHFIVRLSVHHFHKNYLSLSINMSMAWTHMMVGEVTFRPFEWTPPEVRYSGNIESKWT